MKQMIHKTPFAPWRCLTALLFCAAISASATSTINFQVDMSVAATNGTFDPNTQTMATRGSFNGWTTPILLTNNPSGPNPRLYTGSTNVPDNGIVIAYKYTIEPTTTYENTATHNRLLDLPTTSGSTVTAPKVYFSDVPPGDTLPTTVTFQVNMAQQIYIGTFNPTILPS
jgi:hypothetical protein